MKNVLICGAGGFIGGHLAQYLKKLDKYNLICVDVKPKEYWFQISDNNQNYSLDLKEYDNCLKVTKDINFVYNMACNMGGMGFIENNKAECMLSVLINTNLLRACVENKIERYFFSSSACVYNADKQKKVFIDGLKEEDAYPGSPEDGYGWEKLFSERMCRHFFEDFGLETRVARYHNIYGPKGTYDGGREKAPAAISRKIINAKLKNENQIEVWGDGKQTRSFLFIDDCLDATYSLFNSDCREVLNIGSEEQVSINQLIELVEKIAEYKVKKNYLLDKPLGVRGRSSNNEKIKSILNWSPKFSLQDGMEKTYEWISSNFLKRENNNKFTRKID